jgi:hypothetical protein
MTVTLPPDVEDAYRAQAVAKGQPLDQVVRDVLIANQPAPSEAELSADEWMRRLDEWTHSHTDLPVLSDEAMSRESIYADRGL